MRRVICSFYRRYYHVHHHWLWERLSRHRSAAQGRREAVTPRLVHVIPAAQDRVARGTVVTGTLAAEDQVVLSFKVDWAAQ